MKLVVTKAGLQIHEALSYVNLEPAQLPGLITMACRTLKAAGKTDAEIAAMLDELTQEWSPVPEAPGEPLAVPAPAVEKP